MSADYKPGLYVATVRGVPDVRVFRTLAHDELGWFCPVYQATDLGNGWWPDDDEVSEVRPLVVLDPDDVEQVKTFRDWLGSLNYYGTIGQLQSSLRQMAQPPKPAEPQGLGAVVEDTEGVLWVRSSLDGEDSLGKPWKNGPVCKHWQIVDAVRVLSEGVQP